MRPFRRTIFKSKKSIRLISFLKKFLKNYTFVACFYDFRYARVILNLTQASEKIIPLISFFCHWNRNSIAAHSFLKLLLLKAYNIQHKLDMIFFSETFLDFSIPTNVEKLNMKGHKLIRTGNPNDSKKRLCGHL